MSHFLGDITQPLHDEEYKYGANDIDVTWNGDKTNLHHCWDTQMPEQYAGGGEMSDAQSYANGLIQQIDNGDYSSAKSGWISGMDINDAQGSAMSWASDANTFVCSDALHDGKTAYDGAELSGDYYNNAIPIINEQIAKGGYRLAAWLNLIVTGSTGM